MATINTVEVHAKDLFVGQKVARGEIGVISFVWTVVRVCEDAVYLSRPGAVCEIWEIVPLYSAEIFRVIHVS